jgi:hypothetical protein
MTYARKESTRISNSMREILNFSSILSAKKRCHPILHMLFVSVYINAFDSIHPKITLEDPAGPGMLL